MFETPGPFKIPAVFICPFRIPAVFIGPFKIPAVFIGQVRVPTKCRSIGVILHMHQLPISVGWVPERATKKQRRFTN